MAGHPLQRNQQQSIVIGGLTYTWNPNAGKYLTADGMGMDGFRYYGLSQGQQERVGEYTWDYTTGKYKNAAGQEMGAPGSTPLPNSGKPAPGTPGGGPDTGLPVVPGPGQGNNPPAPPPPSVGWGQTPVQGNYGWGTGWGGSHAGATSPFADQTGVQQAFYQLHPDEANYLLRSWLAPNASSPYAQFIDARTGDLYKQYTNETTKTGKENLQYTDWLKSNFGQLSDQFANQSMSQRGENPMSFGGGFAGRKTFA